jgi:hypothetical protein
MIRQSAGTARPKRGFGGMNRYMAIGLAAVVAGCAAQVPVKPPQKLDLGAAAVQSVGEAPPAGPEGACWERDTIPAIYETTTEQSLVTPETRDAGGRVVTPAAYQSTSRLKMVDERRDVWFRAPCPDEMDLVFIATLQRALKARGYYEADISGKMDSPTREALRRYQAEHGLDSPKLSLAAAQALGLSVTALDDAQ